MTGKTSLLSRFTLPKFNFKVKVLTVLTALFVSAFFVVNSLLAAVTVTPATGGTNISIDTTTAGGTSAWTALGSITGPTIVELQTGQISAGLHTLTLPSGWEFNTTQNITIGVGGGSNISLSSNVVTPSATSVSFIVNSVSTNNPATLNFSAIQVRPTTSVVSSGDITHSGAFIADVTDGVTNFGTLSTTAGTATKLAFTTQPADTVYGSNINTVVVKTQDQFGNDSTAGLAANELINLTKSSGTGTLSGTGLVLANIGTSGSNGTLSYSDLYINNVGTKVLQAANISFSPLTTATSNSFQITQKPLTSTITASNKVYNGNTSATILTRTPVGVVGGDTVTVNGGTATFDNKNIGTGKAVTATGMTLGGADAAKYSFDGTGTGTADITALPLTITADAGQTKVYGNTDPSFTYSLMPALVGGDTATGALARAAGENVGLYAINQGTWSVGSNYSVTFVSDNLSITQRPITVTGAANTKVYDGNTSSATNPTITAGTLAFSDTPAFTQTYSTPVVGTSKTMTPAGMVNDGNGGANYNVTLTPANVGTITTKGLDVTGLSAPSKVYDQGISATIMGAPVLNGIVGVDVVNVMGAPAGDHNTANVGNTTVTVTGLSLGGADAANYHINPIILNSSITAYPVTVTADGGQSKIYNNGADPVFTYSSTGLLVGDNFTGALARVAGENVGLYMINQGTLTAGNNYAITFNGTNFTINPKPITVTANLGQSKVYGDADPVFAYTPSPALVGGDSFTGALARVAGENVGAYAMTQNTLSAGANYTITFVANNFSITAKPITVTPNAGQSKIYGTPDPVFAYTFSPALIIPDAFSGALDRAAGSNAGTYAFTIGTLTAGSNYNLSLSPEIFTINQATPVITWADPAAIAAGTPLSGTQLNASANVPGVFTYTPSFGHVFTLVGTEVLSTNFVPTDTLNYTNASDTANLQIVPAVIHHLEIDATPTSQTVSLPIAVTVTGYDQYNNLVTNDSTTRVYAHSGGYANLNSASKVLVAGVAGFTLNSLMAGDSLVDTFSGNLIPDEVTVTFTGDTVAPIITPNGAPVQNITQNSASIVFQSSETGQAKIHYGLSDSYGSVTNYQNVTASTDKSITITGLTCGTVYHYSIYAKDLAGNEAISTDATFTSAACVVPVIPTVAVNGAAILSQYTVSEADARFSAGVQFDLTNAASVTVNGSPVAPAATITAATNAEAKTLGVHSYDVIVLSATGHSASRNISFTVVANPDTTAPVITPGTVTPAPTSVSITFSSSEDGQARINYGATNSYGITSPEYSVLAATSRTITITGLTCETEYHYSIGASDLANNVSNTSDASFTTGACPTGDMIAPSTSNISVTDITKNSASVHFTTDEDGLAKVHYGLNAPAYGLITEYSPMTTATDNIINLTGLTCGTTYHFKVNALDTSDNGSNSSDMTFSTSACPVVPVITHVNPTDVNADQISAEISFASSKAGTAQIYYGLSDSYGNLTGESAVLAATNTSITITGLYCGTTYHYGISAKDTEGNESVITDAWFETLACGTDITAPNVVSQTPADGDIDQALNVAPTVTFSEIMDLATINASTVQLRKVSDDSIVNAVVTLDNSGLVATITPVASLASGTEYYIYVVGAKDLAGNDVVAYTDNSTQEFTTVAAPTGTFGIVSAIMTKMTGIANDSYTSGWEWLIRMTLPTDQNNFALKFTDWVSGANTLSAGGNMQYYSEQISSGLGSSATPVNITATDVYPANIQVTNDADDSMDGIQTDIHVRVKLPATTPSGSYSSSYRVNYSN